MSVKWKTEFDKLPQMTATTKAMSNRKVKVGALEGEHAWLAGIHEYGCDIVPKNAQYLTVPVHPKAKGKKASSFNDLWTYRSKSGELFLCQDSGKDGFEILYWLTKSVKIPERSFLRTGHDENIDRILKQTERLLGQVVIGKLSMDEVLDTFGKQMRGAIQNKIRSIKSPPNSWATKESKGDDNPLIDSGHLIESITWKVE